MVAYIIGYMDMHSLSTVGMLLVSVNWHIDTSRLSYFLPSISKWVGLDVEICQWNTLNWPSVVDNIGLAQIITPLEPKLWWGGRTELSYPAEVYTNADFPP